MKWTVWTLIINFIICVILSYYCLLVLGTLFHIAPKVNLTKPDKNIYGAYLNPKKKQIINILPKKNIAYFSDHFDIFHDNFHANAHYRNPKKSHRI